VSPDILWFSLRISLPQRIIQLLCTPYVDKERATCLYLLKTQCHVFCIGIHALAMIMTYIPINRVGFINNKCFKLDYMTFWNAHRANLGFGKTEELSKGNVMYFRAKHLQPYKTRLCKTMQKNCLSQQNYHMSRRKLIYFAQLALTNLNTISTFTQLCQLYIQFVWVYIVFWLLQTIVLLNPPLYLFMKLLAFFPLAHVGEAMENWRIY
jgi:hypothetical protein